MEPILFFKDSTSPRNYSGFDVVNVALLEALSETLGFTFEIHEVSEVLPDAYEIKTPNGDQDYNELLKQSMPLRDLWEMALISSSAMMRSEREREVDQTRASSMPDTRDGRGAASAVVPPASPFLTRGKDTKNW